MSKLAKSFGINGNVLNNEDGVVITASGKSALIHQFYRELIKNPPPLSRIKTHQIVEGDQVDYDTFDIVTSQTGGKLNLALTPDFAICTACRKEISDPDDRRYLYPFTTCVNCGPRWSITNTFPFERMHTSIDKFLMCNVCQEEYKDPDQRRFHSQTNGCPDCGIKLQLRDNKGSQIPIESRSIFKKMSELISDEKILAIKNTGGYLLCCDANNAGVIQKLRHLKKRPEKPFAILYPSMELLKKHVSVSDRQSKELESSESPIVILSSQGFRGSLALEELAPGLRQIGVMLPYSGILQLLAKEFKKPMVATSGNIHGSPIISHEDQAFKSIAKIADFFLDHDLDIINAQDDSVVKFSVKHNHRVMFRRSRGFAPNYFDYSSRSNKKILALGGHLKSTIAYTPNDYVYLSQYLGNMDHFEVYTRFIETVDKFRGIFQEDPDCILIDKHPAYLSTQYGMDLSTKLKVPFYEIQHHKAHFASVLGEHHLFDSEDPILGVVWDGTGLGEDGQIWGGEFFSYFDRDMNRIGHFEYFDWLAGDKMSRETRLSLFSLTSDPKSPMIKDKFSPQEINIYSTLKPTNKLKTSSVGRIFDAVASLLGFCDGNSYEGEGAILLENAVHSYDMSALKMYVKPGTDGLIPTYLLWEALYSDYISGLDKERIILNFLFTLANLIISMADSKEMKRIALSGGVFQNTVLIDMLIELSKNKFELFFNCNLAPNDENISFGQLMYYQNCMNKSDKI